MKLIKISLLLFVMAIAVEVRSQQKVKEKDLIGMWKLDFNLEEEFQKAREELEEENVVGKIGLSTVEGFVVGLLDQVEIFMDFQKEGKILIKTICFGEEETESANWYINEKGLLYISDTESYQFKDGDYWVFKDGTLVNFDEKFEQNEVYLIRL